MASRIKNWQTYYNELRQFEEEGLVRLPVIPDFASNNGHMFYLIFSNMDNSDFFIKNLRVQGVSAVFHYLPLHQSDFYKARYKGEELVQAGRYSETLVRLPLYPELNWAGLETALEHVSCVLRILAER